MNKRILGIDPGYGRCGFGVIEECQGKWECVLHGVITTPARMCFEQRLLEIGKDVEKLLVKYRPRAVVIEELFFAKSTTTALKVSEVRGMLGYLCAKKGIEVRTVKPNEVKVAVTGYGKAQKCQMQQMVKTIFRLPSIPKPDDAADALAIAWTGLHKKGSRDII